MTPTPRPYKIRYVFNEAQLPVGLSDEHAAFCREKLALYFDLEAHEVEVSSTISRDPEFAFELDGYSSRTTVSPAVIAEAAKIVLPHLRFMLHTASFNEQMLQAWLPNEFGWEDQHLLTLIKEQRTPALTPAHRGWLTCQLALYSPIYTTRDAELMTDGQLADEVLQAWDWFAENKSPYGKEVFLMTKKKEAL